MEYIIYREVVSDITLLSIVGDIEYDKELFAIILFDWMLASLDEGMKDCSVGR
jgi:hypothetical protein